VGGVEWSRSALQLDRLQACAEVGVALAGLIGWRMILGIIAGGALAVAVAQRFSKLDDASVAGLGFRARLRFLADRRLLAILALTVAVVTGEFVVYAYLSVIIGGGHTAIAVALAVFGVGTTAGTLLGGFLVDRFGWRRLLSTSMAVVATALLCLAVANTEICACLLIWGLFGWTFTPAQVNRLFATFEDTGAMLRSPAPPWPRVRSWCSLQGLAESDALPPHPHGLLVERHRRRVVELRLQRDRDRAADPGPAHRPVHERPADAVAAPPLGDGQHVDVRGAPAQIGQHLTVRIGRGIVQRRREVPRDLAPQIRDEQQLSFARARDQLLEPVFEAVAVGLAEEQRIDPGEQPRRVQPHLGQARTVTRRGVAKDQGSTHV
jgi:hypothetical protein